MKNNIVYFLIIITIGFLYIAISSRTSKFPSRICYEVKYPNKYIHSGSYYYGHKKIHRYIIIDSLYYQYKSCEKNADSLFNKVFKRNNQTKEDFDSAYNEIRPYWDAECISKSRLNVFTDTLILEFIYF